MLIGQSSRNLFAPPGSTYGEQSESLGAIYQLLERREGALRVERPPDQIPANVDPLLLWAPAEVPDEEWEALMEWVAAGHTLLFAGESPEGPSVAFSSLVLARPGALHPAVAGVTQIETGGAYFEPLDWPALVMLKDERGRPVLISEPHGKGQIIWSADTDWLSDGLIEEANNLELALGLLKAQPGKVVGFDEYHHGYSASDRWWQLLRGPLQLFILQLGAAVLLFFWASGSRFGRPRPEPLLPARAAVEYVGAMSHLYRRARARGLVQRALYRSLLRSLGGLLGGVRELSHGQIAERTAERTGLVPGLIEGTLNRLGEKSNAPTQPPSEADLLSLARQAAEIQRSVQHAGFRDQRAATKD